MTQFVTTDSSISTKRTAPSDSNDDYDDINKRAKASHRPLALDPTSSSTPDQFNQTIFETPTSADPTLTACESLDKSPTDHAVTTPDSSLAPSAFLVDIPAVPVEAIEKLQHAYTDLLKALVQRDDVNRETQLLIAVGTMRTCLDVHFAPQMDIWFEDTRAAQKIPPSPVTATVTKVSTDPGPPAAASIGPRTLAMVTESLLMARQQMGVAQDAVYRRNSALKEKKHELKKLKAEMNRLKDPPVKAESLAQMQAALPTEPHTNSDPSNTATALEEVAYRQKGELARQEDAIQDFEKRKAGLDAAPGEMSYATIPDSELIAANANHCITQQAAKIGNQRKEISSLMGQIAALKARLVNKAEEKGAVKQRNREMPRELGRIGQGPSDAGHPNRHRWEESRYDNLDGDTWAPYSSCEYEEVDGYHDHGRHGDTGEDIRAYRGQDGWVYGGPGTRGWGHH